MTRTAPVKTLPLQIRPATNSDIPFIFNSWLKSYRDTGPICHNVSNTIYFQNHHKLIQRIMRRALEDQMVVIAADSKDPSIIYGYMVAEKIDGVFVCHYAYVKHIYRSFGLMSLLFKELGHDPTDAHGPHGCFTHYTRSAANLAARYRLIYHPYLAILDFKDTSPTENFGTKVEGEKVVEDHKVTSGRDKA